MGTAIGDAASFVVWSTLISALLLMVVLQYIVQNEASDDCQARGGSMTTIGPLIASIGIIMSVALFVMSCIFVSNNASKIQGISALTIVVTLATSILLGFTAHSLNNNWVCSSSNQVTASDIKGFTMSNAIGLGLFLVVGIISYVVGSKKDKTEKSAPVASSGSPTPTSVHYFGNNAKPST
jgi:hypothetical protein